MEVIFLIGAIQSFFQVIILINKKGKDTPDYILATWMLLIGTHLLLYYLRVIGFDESWPYIQGIEGPIPTVHGPLMLMYVEAQNGKIRKWRWVYILHFMPFLLLYIGYIPYFFLPVEELANRIDVWMETQNPPLFIKINATLNALSGIVYVSWGAISLKKHQNLIGQFFSYEDKINLRWLRNLILGMGVIWLAVIISDITFTFRNEEIELISNGNLIFFTVTLFSFAMSYWGTRQGAIFTNRFEVTQVSQEHNNKYEKSGLKPELAEEYMHKLKEYMGNQKPYLETKLTLPQLSEKIGVPQNHLSQVINERINKNFYEFVNGYRVEEFKSRIKKDNQKNLTLLGHALDSGFSSKSTFNEIFKKMEGMTPSEYLKKV